MQQFKDHSKVISGDSIFFNERKAAAVLAFFLSFARPAGRQTSLDFYGRGRMKKKKKKKLAVSSFQTKNSQGLPIEPS